MLSESVFAALLSILAPAAADPCSMPPELKARVCDVPELRALDAKLVAKERAAAAVTARPATWAARAALFRTWLAAEKDYDGNPLDAEALASNLTDRIDALDKEIARAAGVAKGASEAAILGDKCLTGWLRGCRAPQSGILREGGTRILYQLQSGSSDADGVGMGVMLWDASGAGAPKPIGWTFEGVWMTPPRLDSEATLLWAPGYTAGTGQGNADMLFEKRDGKWVEIELESWKDDLAKRLPAGLAAWHGIDYDLTSLAGSTELWREDKDANCCPTGGRANLQFKIEGNRLVLDEISAQIGGPDQKWVDY